MKQTSISQQIKRLKQLIITTEAYQYYEKPVKLSSGKLSNLYFDIRKLTGLPEGINLVATILYEEIMKISGIRSVGGLEAGSIAISTAISQASYLKDKDTAIESFYVRKEPKKHGLKKWIEGCAKSPAVVVDDVITTGESALKAIEKLRNDHHTADYILTVVYRGTEEERQKMEQKHKIKLRYIFTEADFTK